MSKNKYEILGVDKSASNDEIRRAYRQIALKFHPDKNPGDKKAEEAFKEATEAFSILNDNNKRAIYDASLRNPISDFPFSHIRTPFSGFDIPYNNDLGDIFDNIFNIDPRRGGSRRSRGSGDDVEASLMISIDESIKGCIKKFSIKSQTHQINCQTCNGSGADKGSSKVICPKCGGVGKTAESGFTISTCSTCKGNRHIPIVNCPDCKGTGKIHFQREMTVKIPAGITNGARLRLANMGTPGSPPGDLFLTINIENTETHKREYHDIVIAHKINLKQAILGDTVDVMVGPGMKITITVPPGSKTGDEVVRPGMGTKSLFDPSQKPGDMRIRLEVEIPKGPLSDKAQQLLEKFIKEIEKS